MKYILPTLSLAAILACMASLAQAEPQSPLVGLPANIVSDQTKIIADRAVLKSDFHAIRDGHKQLLTDEDAGKKDAIVTDKASLEKLKAQIKSDFEAVRADREQLHKDIKPIFEANKSTIDAAVAKLKTDRAANNAQAVSADMDSIRRAEEQMSYQKKAIFGPIHREHRHGMHQMGMNRGHGFGGYERMGDHKGWGDKRFDKGDRKDMKSDVAAPAVNDSPDNQ